MRITYSFSFLGGKQEKDFEQASIIIGRPTMDGVRPDLDLTPDETVSRPHARIWVEYGRYWIEDLGSKRGTFVNGEDIKGKGRVEITPGMTAQMGETTLALWADGKESESAGEQGGNEAAQKKNELPSSLLRLRVAVKCSPTINYSLIHSKVSFLSEITLSNDGSELLTDLELHIVLPGYIKFQPISIPPIPAGGSYTITDFPEFSFDSNKLQDLADAETVSLQVWVDDKPLPLTTPINVKLLPPNAWHCVGHEEVLAAFVLNESEAVKAIIERARAALWCLVKERASFLDVLNNHPNPVETIVKAIYFCLQERFNLEYGREPRYYADHWQIVRFPHEVIRGLEGTCIDLALLFVACLENRHLNPVIIIVRTGVEDGYEIHHALIGCWLDEPMMVTPIELDGHRVKQWVEQGQLLLLNSVGFAHGQEADELFGESRTTGKTYLDKACARQDNHDFLYALDICAARYAGIEPMPFGGGLQFDRSAWLAIFRARREAETLQSPFVGARHLLLGLLSLENGLMRQVCARFGEGLADEMAELTRATFPRSGRTQRALPEAEDWQAVMQLAEEIAGQGSAKLVTECVLARALLETPTQVNRVLAGVGLQREQCLDELRALCGEGRVESAWRSSDFTM